MIRAILARLSALQGGRFVKPVLTLLTGVVAAQAFVFIARPVLTRLFTPDEFGVLTLFVTLVMPVSVAAAGRYEDAMMLPTRHRHAINLLVLAVLTAVTTGLLLSVLMIGHDTWARMLNSPGIGPALLVAPLTVALVAIGRLLETWHTRFDRFRLVSIGRTLQSGVVVAVQVTAGVLGASALGLVGGTVAGFSVLVVFLIWTVLRHDRALFQDGVRWPRMRILAFRYRRFPFFAAPAAFLNMMSGRVVIPLLSVFFGATPVGLYGIAFGTLSLPIGLVTGAVGQVFFVRAAEALRVQGLGVLTNDVFRRLTAVSLFPMAAAMVAGPALFGFVFGEVWVESGVYARLLAPWLFVSALAAPLTRVFDVTERQRTDLGFSIFLVVVQIITLVALGRTSDVRTTVTAVAIVGTLSRTVQIGWLLHSAGASFSRALRDLAVLGLLAAPFLAIIYGTQVASSSGLLLLAVVALTGGGYLGLAALLDKRITVQAASP